MAIVIALVTIVTSLAGLIVPNADSPVSSYSTNIGDSTVYKFKFTLATKVPSGSTISVEFPSEYPDLTEAVCTGYNLAADTPSSLPCQKSGQTVTWTMGSVNKGPVSLAVEAITNPSTKAGTGRFKVYSYENAIIRDKNTEFALAGISGPPAAIEATLSTALLSVTNATPILKFTATLTETVLSGSWARITAASDYTVGDSLTCFVEEIGRNVNCKRDEILAQVINIDPINTNLTSSLTIRVDGVRNPPEEMITGTSVMEILEENTFNVLFRDLQISGTSVGPGHISRTLITGSRKFTNGLGIYHIYFYTNGDIPSGGRIEIDFPSTFQNVVSCEVLSGLSSATCTQSSNKATISGFSAFSAGKISVQANATNPASSGQTEDFKIYSFSSSGNLIDQNENAGYLFIGDIDTPITSNAEMFNVKTVPQLGQFSQLEFNLQTRTQLPANTGKIVLTLPIGARPPDANEGGAPTGYSCLFGSSLVPAKTCTYNSGSREITIETPANHALEECPLSVVITTLGSPTTTKTGFVMTSPGRKEFAVQTFISNVKQEVFNFYYFQKPRELGSTSDLSTFHNLGSATAELLHFSVSYQNTIKITFDNAIEIPINGGVEIEFVTKNYGFPFDLGLGMHSLETNNYNSYVISPVWDATATCVVTSGTTEKSAFIRIVSPGAAKAANSGNTDIVLYNIRNGAFTGYVPKIVFKTLDANMVTMEYKDIVTGTALKGNSAGCLSTGHSSTLTITNSTPENLSAIFQFTVVSSFTVDEGDKLMIEASNDFYWDSATTFDTTCGGSGALTNAANYDKYFSTNFKGFIFTQPTGSGSLASINPCFTIKNRLYQGDTTFRVLQVSNFEVVLCHDITSTTFTPGTITTIVINELLPSSTEKVREDRTLLQVSFTAPSRLPSAGSASIMFPSSAFTINESSCYEIVSPAGAACKVSTGHSHSGVTYDRYVLHSFGSDLSAGTTFTAKFFIDTPSTASAYTLVFLTNDLDDSTSNIIDFATPTFDYSASFASATSATMSTIMNPLLYTRAGGTGPLEFRFYPSTALQASISSAVTAKLVITLPVGFSVPGSTVMKCWINSVLSSACSESGGDVTVFTSRSQALSANTWHTVRMTALRDGNADEVGFNFPPTFGDYQFRFSTYIGTSLIETGEPWLHLPPTNGFSYIYIDSLQKLSNQWNFLRLDFLVGSNLSTPKSEIWIEFPRTQWASDLGTGISNNGLIDCVTLTGHSAGVLTCYLVHGAFDYTVVKVTGSFTGSESSQVFKFFLGPIKNPATDMTDLQIRFRAMAITESSETYTAVHEDLIDYIDTTMSVASTPDTISSPDPNFDCLTQSTAPHSCIQPALSASSQTFQVNLQYTLELFATDWVFVQFPVDFSVSSPTCSINSVSGSCYVFPNTRWVLAVADSIPSNSIFKFRFDGVTVPGYQYSVTGSSFIISDRKLSREVTYAFATANWLTEGTFTSAEILNYYDYYSSFNSNPYKHLDTYRIRIEVTNRIPSTGQLKLDIVSFDSTLYPKTCAFTGENSISIKGLQCAVSTSGTDTSIVLSGFASDYAGTNIIEFTIQTENTVGARTYAVRINSYWESANTDKLIDNIDISYSIVPYPNTVNPAESLASFEFGEKNFLYQQDAPARTNSGIGPLQFYISSPTTITQEVGTLTIVHGLSFDLDLEDQLRCVWTSNNVEKLAFTCTYSAGTFTVSAPLESNLNSNTQHMLTITTVNRPIEQGLQWTSDVDWYKMDLSLDVDGDSSTDYILRVYTELYPAEFTNVALHVGHYTQNDWTLFDISLTTCTNIPSSANGGRIIVEFPTDLFTEDLGYTAGDNTDVPCLAVTGFSSDVISCFLEEGSTANSEASKVIVTSFSAISSGTALRFFLSKIKNPNVNGNDKIVSLNIYATDISTDWQDWWPGKKLCQSYTRYSRYLLANSPVASSPSSPYLMATSTSLEVDQTDTYTITLQQPTDRNPRSNPGNSAGWGIRDYILVFLPVDIRLASNSACTITSHSCYLNVQGKIIIAKINSDASGDLTISITLVTNPIHDYAVDPTFTVYYMQEGYLTQTLTLQTHFDNLTPKNFVTPPTAVRLHGASEKIYEWGIYDYLFTITLDLEIPADGALVLDLNGGDGLTATESRCYMFYDSGYTGTYECSVQDTNDKFYFIPNAQVPSGTVLKLVGAMKCNGTCALTTAINFYTVFDNTDIVDTRIQETTPHLDLSSLLATELAPDYFEVPRPYMFQSELRMNEIAPLVFSVTPFTQITQSAGFLRVTLSSFPDIPATSELRCLWDGVIDLSCSKSYSSTTLTVITYAPANTVSATEITITTTNTATVEADGLQFPATAGDYNVQVEIFYDDNNGGGASDEIGIMPFRLFADTAFTSLAVAAEHSTANVINAFRFTIGCGAHCTTVFDTLRVYFPTKDKWDNTLFPDNLGFSVADTFEIPCDGLGDMSALTCYLHYGDNNRMRPAYVEINSLTVDNSASTITFIIDKVMNPAAVGSSDRHIHITVEGILSSVVVRSETYFDVITLTNESVTPGASTYTLSSNSGLESSTDVNLTIGSNTSSDGVILIYFITDWDISGMTSSNTIEIHPDARVIRMTYNTAFNPTDSYTLPELAIKMIQGNTDIVMHRFEKASSTLTYRVHVETKTYSYSDSSFTTFAADSRISYSPSLSGYQQNEPVWITYSVDPSITVHESNCLEIVPPMGAEINYCLSPYDNQVGVNIAADTYPFFCEVTASKITVKGFYTSGDNTLTVKSLYQPTASGFSGSVTAKLYINSDCSVQYQSFSLTSLTAPPTPTNAATSAAPAEFYFPVPETLPFPAIESDRVDIEFYLRLGTTLTYSISNFLRVEASNAFDALASNAVLVCFIETYTTYVRIATECTINGGLTEIHIYPTQDLLANTDYTVTVTSYNADSANDGLGLQAAANTFYTLKVEVNQGGTLSEGIYYYRSPVQLFTAFKVTPSHISASLPNVFELEFDHDYKEFEILVIEFPTKSRVGNLFSNDLGSGIENGDLFPCKCTGCGGTEVCYLFHGEQSTYTPAEVHILNLKTADSSTASFTLMLAGITNPPGQDDQSVVDIRVYVMDQNDKIVRESVAYNVLATSTTVSTTSHSGLSVPVSYTADDQAVTLAIQNTNTAILVQWNSLGYDVSTALANGGNSIDLFSTGNWIYATNTAVTTQPFTIDGPQDQITTGRSIVYEISEKLVTRVSQQDQISNSFNQNQITITPSLPLGQKGYPYSWNFLTLSFATTNIDILSTHTLQIYLSDGSKGEFTDIDGKTMIFTIDGKEYHTTWQMIGGLLTITGFGNDIPATTTFAVTVRVRNPSSVTNTKVTIEVYNGSNLYTSRDTDIPSGTIFSSNGYQTSGWHFEMSNDGSNINFTVISRDTGSYDTIEFDTIIFSASTPGGSCNIQRGSASAVSCSPGYTTNNHGSHSFGSTYSNDITLTLSVPIGSIDDTPLRMGSFSINSKNGGSQNKYYVYTFTYGDYISGSFNLLSIAPSSVGVVQYSLDVNEFSVGLENNFYYIGFDFYHFIEVSPYNHMENADPTDSSLVAPALEADLGLGIVTGDLVPAHFEHSSPDNENWECRMRKADDGEHNPGFICHFKGASPSGSGTLTFTFPMVKTVNNVIYPTKVRVSIFGYDSTPNYRLEKESLYSLTTATGSDCNTPSTGSESIPDSTVEASIPYTLTWNANSAGANSWMLLSFPTFLELSALPSSTSGLTLTDGIYIPNYPCPCLLYRVSSSFSANPSVTLSNLPNPLDSKTHTISGWLFNSDKSCNRKNNWTGVTINPDSFSSCEILNLRTLDATITYNEETTIRIKFANSHVLPQNGMIRVEIPTSSVSSISMGKTYLKLNGERYYGLTFVQSTHSTSTYIIISGFTEDVPISTPFQLFMYIIAQTTSITITIDTSTVHYSTDGATIDTSDRRRDTSLTCVSGGTFVLTAGGSPTFLGAGNLRFPPSLRTIRKTPSAHDTPSSAEQAPLVFYFKPIGDINPSTNLKGRIDIELSSDITVNSGDNHYALITDVSTRDQYLAYEVTHSANKFVIAAPTKTTLSTSKLYKVEIGSQGRKGLYMGRGMTMDTFQIDSGFDYIGTDTFTADSSMSGQPAVPLGVRLTSLRGFSFVSDPSTANMFRFEFQMNEALSDGWITIEFPAAFSASNPAHTAWLSSNDPVKCFMTYTSSSGAREEERCVFSEHVEIDDNRQVDLLIIRVYPAETISANTDVKIWIADLSNTALFINTGVTIKAYSAEVLKFQTHLNGFFNVWKAQSITNTNRDVPTGGYIVYQNNYMIEHIPAIAVDPAVPSYIIFKVNPTSFKVTGTSDINIYDVSGGSDPAETVQPLPKAGWILLQTDSTTLLTSRTYRFTFTNIFMRWQQSTDFISADIVVNSRVRETITWDQLPGGLTVMIGPGTISIGSIQPSTKYIADKTTYTIPFTITNEIPDGGAIYVKMPTGFEPDDHCSATSSGFSSNSDIVCTLDSVNKQWKFTHFGSCTAGSTVTATGIVTAPASTSVSSYWFVYTYKDSSGTFLIDQQEPTSSITLNSSRGLIDPDNFHMPYFALISSTKPLRSAKGPLTFIFEHKSTISPASTDDLLIETGSATVFAYTASTGKAVCKFTSAAGVEYSSDECSFSSGTWTVKMPKLFTPGTGQKWTVSIFTTGEATDGLDIVDPSTVKRFIEVAWRNSGPTILWETTDVVEYLVGKTFDQLTIKPLITNAGASSLFHVSFTASSMANDDYLVIEFPTYISANTFEESLSLAEEDANSNLGCAFKNAASYTQQDCKIRFGNRSGSYLQKSVAVIVQFATAITTQVDLYIPQVLLPTGIRTTSYVQAKIFTLTGNNELLKSESVMWYALMNQAASTLGACSTANSMMASMSTKVTRQTGVTFSLTANAPSSFAADDYVLFKAPHDFGSSVGISTNCATLDITFDTLEWVLCQHSSALSGTISFSFTGWDNQFYNRASNAMYALFIKDRNEQSCYDFTTSDTTYTPDTFVTPSVSAYDGVDMARNHHMAYQFALELKALHTTPMYFKISMPAGFTLDKRCRAYYSTHTIYAARTHMSCKATGTDVLISDVDYTSIDRLLVELWVTNPSGSSSSHSVTLQSCREAACTEIMDESTVSFTTTNTEVLLSTSSVVSPILRSSDRVVRLDEYADIVFRFTQPSVTTVRKVGRFEVNFPANLIKLEAGTDAVDNLQCRAVWDNGFSVYMAYNCELIAEKLTIYTPEDVDITGVADWIVRVTTINTANPGFLIGNTLSSLPFRLQVDLYSDATDANIDFFSFPSFNVAPPGFTSSTVQFFVASSNEMNSLLFDFNGSIPEGLESNTGKAEIVVQFDPTIWSANMGTSVSTADYTDNWGQTDCAGITAACYVRRGDSTDSLPNGEIWVRQFSAISSSVQLVLLPLTNPSNAESMANIVFYAREWDTSVKKYKMLLYREFNYVFFTDTKYYTTNSYSAYSATYVNLDFTSATTSSVTFDVRSSTIDVHYQTSTATIGGFVLQLSESYIDVTGVTSTTANLYLFPLNNYLLFTPTSALDTFNASLTAITVAIANMNIPSFAAPNTWTGWIWYNGKYTDSIAYTPQTVSSTTITSMTPVLLTEFSHPYVSRQDEHTFSIDPSQDIPQGGSIFLTVPNTYSAISNECIVVQGLTGTWTCAKSSTLVWKVSGFNAYTQAGAAKIQLRGQLTASSSAGAVGNYQVDIYAIDGDSNTLIESITQASGLTITSRGTEVSSSFELQRLVQLEARAAETAELKLLITPKTAAYEYTDTLRLYIDSSASVIDTGTHSNSQIQCFVSDKTNYVRAETCEQHDATNDYFELTVPEQMPMAVGTEYEIYLRYMFANSFADNGITLPTTVSEAYGVAFWVEITDVSASSIIEKKKMVKSVRGKAFNAHSVYLGHRSISYASFLEVSLTTPSNILATDFVRVSLESHNGLEELFSANLGLGYAVNSVGAISCKKDSHSALTCEVAVPDVPGSGYLDIPINIYPNAATNSFSFRLVDIMNPSIAVDSVHSNALTSIVKVYVVRKFEDYELILYEDDLYLFLDLYSATPASVTSTVTSDETLTQTDFSSNGLVFSLTSSASVDGSNGGYMIVKLPTSFILPEVQTNAIAAICPGGACTGLSFKDRQWITVDPPSGSNSVNSLTLDSSNGFTSPEYTINAGYSIAVHVVSNYQLVEVHTTLLLVRTAKTTSVSVAPQQGSIPRNYYDLYTITINPCVDDSVLKRVDIKFPTTYQFVDATCKELTGVTGLSGQDLVCQSDCATLPCTMHIQIYNFDYTGSDIVVIIGAKSPNSFGNPGFMTVHLYADLTDTSLVIEEKTDVTLGNVEAYSSVYDFWVDWVDTLLYDRKVRAGDISELILRLETRNNFAVGSELYAKFPFGFGPALGGTVYCEFGHGDLYYDNFPLYWNRNYSHPVSTECNWQQDTLHMKFSTVDTSEFSGLTAGDCTYINITTTGLTHNGINAPGSAGRYEIEVLFYEQTNLKEVSFPVIYVAPADMPADLTILMSHYQNNFDAILKVQFTADRYIPPGKAHVTNNVQGDVGSIEVLFDLYESFADNLGYYSDGNSVVCYSISGLTGTLTCTFTQGDSSLSRPSSSVITMTGFDEVQAGTVIEFHIPIVKNPATATHMPRVGVGIYQTSVQGIVLYIYEPVYKLLSIVSAGSIQSESTTAASVLSTTVGISTTLELPFTSTATMDASNGDHFVIILPSQYPLSLTGLGLVVNNGGSPMAVAFTFNSYPDAHILVFYMATGTVLAANSYTLEISGMVNPYSVLQCTSCTIAYYNVISNNVRDRFRTGDIDDNLSLTVGGLSDTSVDLSSYKANDIKVTVTVGLTPSVPLPLGSKLHITMNNHFPLFSHSDPIPTCSAGGSLTCTAFDRSVEIKGFSDLYTSAMTVTISGVKNPSTVGPLGTGSSNFRVYAWDGDNYQIIYHEFTNEVTIGAASEVVDMIYDLSRRFNARDVLDTYTISFKAPFQLNANSVLHINFPSEIDASKASLTNDYFRVWHVSATNVLELTLYDDLSVGTEITLVIYDIKNPNVSTTSSALRLEIHFDGKLVVQSMQDASLAFNAKPSNFRVYKRDFYPQNAGEHATYYFKIRAPFDISEDDNYFIYLRFPYEFSEELAISNFKCTTSPIFSVCKVNTPREIEISGIVGSIEKNDHIELTLYGIVNPDTGNTGYVSIYLFDSFLGYARAYAQNAVHYTIKEHPGVFEIQKTDVTEAYTNTLADFTFSVNMEGEIVKSSNVFWIDWPQAIFSEISQSSFTCEMETPTQYTLTCTNLVDTGYARTQITGHPDISYNPEVKIKVFNVSTPKTKGKVYFSIRAVDLVSKLVLYRSYSTLSSASSVTFKKYIYSIDAPSAITVYQGTYSEPQILNLQEGSFSNITVTPMSSDLSFSPSSITLQYSWGVSSEFRIGAASTLSPGVYSVSFSKEEESGGSTYLTIPDLSVTVEAAENPYMVTISDISEINEGGTSLPVYVSLERPVRSPLFLHISSPSSLVKLNTTSIMFEDGDSSKAFTLEALTGSSSGDLSFTLYGDSKDSYELTSTSKSFTIIESATIPEVISLGLNELGRVSASVKVQMNAQAEIFYLYSYAGTVVSSPQAIASRSVRSDVSVFYGETNTQDGTYTAIIDMTNLEDSTNYVFHLSAKNTNDQFTSSVSTLYFRTKSSLPSIYFRIYVISFSSFAAVIEAIARTLAIPTYLFEAGGRDPRDFYPGRILTDMMYYPLILHSDNTHETSTPAEMITELSTKMTELNANLPELNTSELPSSSMEVMTYQQPSFTQNVTLSDSAINKLAFEVHSDTDGKVYGVLLEVSADMPTSIQIKRGLNSTNSNALYSNDTAIASSQATTIEFSGISSGRYKAYFTLANNKQLNADLSADTDVQGLIAFTPNYQEMVVLQTDAALALLSALLVLFLI